MHLKPSCRETFRIGGVTRSLLKSVQRILLLIITKQRSTLACRPWESRKHILLIGGLRRGFPRLGRAKKQLARDLEDDPHQENSFDRLLYAIFQKRRENKVHLLGRPSGRSKKREIQVSFCLSFSGQTLSAIDLCNAHVKLSFRLLDHVRQRS